MVIGQALIGLVVFLVALLSFLVPLPGWIPMVLFALVGLALMAGGSVIFTRRGTAV